MARKTRVVHLRAVLLFLAGFATAALESPASSSIRLFQIPVHRFSVDDAGQRWAHHGQLDSFGGFHHESTEEVPESVTLPPEALDRNLIRADAWYAYRRLGPEAVANFVVPDELFHLRIGNRDYGLIQISDDARFDLGNLVNISTRSAVTPGGEPLIAGFVI